MGGFRRLNSCNSEERFPVYLIARSFSRIALNLEGQPILHERGQLIDRTKAHS